MPLDHTIFLVQLGSAGFMTGLIWFVQTVHYPLLSRVGIDAFGDYHRDHVRRITPLVGLAMLTEMLTAVALLWVRPEWLSAVWVWIGLGLLAVIWASTGWTMIPLHNRLATGFDAAVHRKLVLGNWIRTAAWTVRAIMLLAVTVLR